MKNRNPGREQTSLWSGPSEKVVEAGGPEVCMPPTPPLEPSDEQKSRWNYLPVRVPDGQSGDWKIETFQVTRAEEEFSNLRAAFNGGRGRLERIQEGVYKRLMRGRTVVMSNTPMEVETNLTFLRNAMGVVLINGLGLGMILDAALKKPEVKEIWVVENSQDVINLVGPAFQDDPRVKIIHADAMTYKAPAGQRFDCVYHDIWDFITADNLEDMKTLHRKYGRRAEWQGSWAREWCEAFSSRSF